MAKKKKSKDVNQRPSQLFDLATGQSEDTPLTADGKNAAAVALGKKGGLKGGPARAKKLSPKRRAEIAKKAAAARWGKKSK